MKNRLKKLALMDPEMFESTLDQISDKGRAILQSIEEYKFNIDQTLRVVKNDPALSNIINQKKKNLDHAAQDLYMVVFEIENIDITEAYNEQSTVIQPSEEKTDEEKTKEDKNENKELDDKEEVEKAEETNDKENKEDLKDEKIEKK